MITLTILCIIYTLFGLRKHKKLYGHYDVFDNDIQLWTLLLVLSATLAFSTVVIFIITFLP